MIKINISFTSGDVCQLETKCKASYGTHCDTKYISSSFPPGSYHCMCDDGFVPSSSNQRAGNVILPSEKCVRKTTRGTYGIDLYGVCKASIKPVSIFSQHLLSHVERCWDHDVSNSFNISTTKVRLRRCWDKGGVKRPQQMLRPFNRGLTLMTCE